MTSGLIFRLKFTRLRWRGWGTPYAAIHFHSDDKHPPCNWYQHVFAKLFILAHSLSNVEHIDGRLVHAHDHSIIVDHAIEQRMREFDSIAREFIGYSSTQQDLMATVAPLFSTVGGRRSLVLDSLTKVCNFLGVSPQQRQRVRYIVCMQVTQHRIWRESIEEILKNLSTHMGLLHCRSRSFQMGQQIASSCTEFLADASGSDSDPSCSSSWMSPIKMEKRRRQPLATATEQHRNWGEVLEMFIHLSKCLAHEQRLEAHAKKVESMKEGLAQIKDLLVEREAIGYREARRQDSLVQKKLSRALGHSSRCLFTLLLYYLYGSGVDIEVEVCGGIRKSGDTNLLCLGKILTSDEEGMVGNGMKQLSRALGLFQFIWETAGMKGKLELQGHLWCLGAEERSLLYRGNQFFVHEIKPP